MRFPGATIEVDVGLPPPPSTSDRVSIARRRPLVRDQILTCTRCPLSAAQWVRAPVPFVGPTPAAWVIVGEAPGEKENRVGRPFEGPAGQMLRGMLEEARLDVARALIVNAVCCFPGDTPDERAIRACRVNLDAQLDLARTPFVLLLGGVALGGFRPDVRIMAVSGTTFVQGGRVMMPLVHPAWVLRNRQARRDVVEKLEGFRRLIHGELAPSHLFGDRCAVGCGAHLAHYDPEGMPWCANHWAKRAKTPTERTAEHAKKIATKVKAARKRASLQRQGAM